MSVKPVAWTPGPWKLAMLGDKGHIITIYSEREDDVVHWSGFDSSAFSIEQQQANARLIASAPELAEALQELMEQAAQQNEAHGNNSLTPAIIKAKNLLARITPK